MTRIIIVHPDIIEDDKPADHGRYLLAGFIGILPLFIAGIGVILALDTSREALGLGAMLGAVMLYYPCQWLSLRVWG